MLFFILECFTNLSNLFSVTCETEDKKFGVDETLRYEKNSALEPANSMDVVFVVEERLCNRDMAKQLKSLITRMENLLGTNFVLFLIFMVQYLDSEEYYYLYSGQYFS